MLSFHDEGWQRMCFWTAPRIDPVVPLRSADGTVNGHNRWSPPHHGGPDRHVGQHRSWNGSGVLAFASPNASVTATRTGCLHRLRARVNSSVLVIPCLIKDRSDIYQHTTIRFPNRNTANWSRRRIRHRDRKTKGRPGYPASGPRLTTRTTPAEISACPPLTVRTLITLAGRGTGRPERQPGAQ
jgi:hypothetical protein